MKFERIKININKIIISAIWYLILLLDISTICSAQIKLSDFNDFKHYTDEDGLASSYIRGVQEDKYGFLG